ncbi:hypothetical protein K504DRAFT_503463 [Pleomassaria siparia CBS 279.74]|uniref:Uncharacterized protein n=1 Tax=Pleomassaria siparia CBS 279.74 TaxID=1314801 RepID=A0A6G1K757_9PLEO|nr:hypothetical protein K504DRAFT_503463 [Pleomassaria siparia CBS 279.74]
MSKKNPPRDIRSFFTKVSIPAKVQPATSTIPVRTSVENHTSQSSSSAKSTPRLTPTSKQPVKRRATDAPVPPQTSRADSLPPSTSQSSTNSTGKKRIVSNGKPIVLNSDSDTDSDGLLELELNLIRPSVISRTTGAISRTDRSAPYIELLENGLRRPSDNHKRPKPSLDRYVKDAQTRVATERKMAEGKADLDNPTEETLPSGFAVTEAALAGQIDGDEAGAAAKQLFVAMQRTAGLDTNCVFHFFNAEPASRSTQHSPFPTQSLPQQGWAARFDNPWDREQAFCSGFAYQVFQYQQLPSELASWMIDQVCHEQNELLSTKYLEILEAYPQHLHALIDSTKLESIFKILGADLQCLHPSKLLNPSYEQDTTPRRPLPGSLKWVVLLLQKTITRCKAEFSLPFKTYTRILFILIHLSFDDSVTADAGVLHAVQDTIELIMCSISDIQLTPILTEIVPLLLERITHPILQNKLVSSLPIKSPLAAYFQRDLALAMLIHPTPLQIPLSSPQFTLLINDHLRTSPHFKITTETNYVDLAARISLLDTAIGPGPLTVPYQSPSGPTETEELPVATDRSLEGVAFNKEVDALVKIVKQFSNGIHEVGAIDDLTRLDAKDCCERLYHRLENAVRIGGRRKTNIFDAEDQTAPKKVLQNWLNKKRVHTATLAMNKDERSAEGFDSVDPAVSGSTSA